MEKITVRGTVFDTELSKICVPIMGTNIAALAAEAKEAAEKEVDVVEWRADYFTDLLDFEAFQLAAKEIRAQLQSIPLIFTLRTKREGGVFELPNSDYERITIFAASVDACDFIDIEFTQPNVTELISAVNKAAKISILSSHNFSKTPPQAEILAIFEQMSSLSADILKIAVMPHSSKDVLALLGAAETFKQREKQPFIAISMGQLGLLSRVVGGMFGSILTFAALEEVSAPGQLPVKKLQGLLEIFQGKALH